MTDRGSRQNDQWYVGVSCVIHIQRLPSKITGNASFALLAAIFCLICPLNRVSTTEMCRDDSRVTVSPVNSRHQAGDLAALTDLKSPLFSFFFLL